TARPRQAVDQPAADGIDHPDKNNRDRAGLLLQGCDVYGRGSHLTLKAPDPANLAAELGRQELRTYLRGLSQADRDAITRAESLDPKLAEAILSAPIALSGVSQVHYDTLRNRAIEAQNPGVSENLREMEEAIGVLEKTISANREGIARE